MNFKLFLKNRTLLLLIVFLCFGVVNAANRYSVGSGNWNSIATWSATSGGAPGASFPIAGDVVTIESGFNVTLTAAAACSNLNIAALSSLNTGATFALGVSGITSITGTLTLAGSGTKTFTGAVTINSGGVITQTAAASLIFGNDVTITGTFTEFVGSAVGIAGNLTNNGTYTASTGLHTFSGATKTIGGTTLISIGSIAVTGTYANNNTLTVGTALSGTGALTQGATGILNIGGTSTITTLSASTIGNMVNYTGALAQTVKSAAYYNLTFSGTGIATTAAAEIIGGNLVINTGATFKIGANFTLGVTGTTSITGTFTLAGTGAKTFTGNVTINTGGIWSETGIALINCTGNLLNSGAFTASTGIHTFNASLVNNGTFTGSTTIFNITSDFTNTGTFIMTTGQLNISIGNYQNTGTYKMSSGQLMLSAGNFTNTGIFSFTGAGKLILAGNYTNSVISPLSTTIVQFIGTNSQSIQAFTTGGTVSMLKTGGTATFIGNVNGGGLTINGVGGTLNLGLGLTHTFTGAVTLTAGTLNANSSTLNEKANGAAWVGTGSIFVAGTGTVNFGGTSQTLSATATTFNNLIFSVSGLKTLTTAKCTINGILTMQGTAAASAPPTYGANATLIYDTPTLHSIGAEWISPFAATGGVIIKNTGKITLNAAKVFNASIPLNIYSGAILSTGNFGLTFGGNFINNGGTFTAGSSPIVISNTMTSQSISGFTTTGLVSMTKTAGTATFTSNVGGAGLTINGAGGTLNLGTVLTHTFTGVVTLTAGILNGGSSILNENATSATAWNGTGSIFVAGTSTVVFGGAAQTLSATTTTFNNLTFSTSGVKTLTTANCTINGILTMQGTATVSAAPTYGSTATLQYNTITARTSGVEWITPFAATGGVIIANTGIITVNANKAFNATVPMNITAGATLNSGTFAITGGSILSIVNTGKLNLSGTSAFPTFPTTALGTLSTVIYSGTIQTVATKSYGNLSLSGTSNKTFTGATTIAGVFDISGSAVAILPNATSSSAASLTFAGVLQASGSWGGTTSVATHTDLAHFGNISTGFLNNNIPCVAGTWQGNFTTDWNTAGNWCGNIIPSATTDVIIPSSPMKQPIIGALSYCKSIAINSGATLTITGSNTLTVSGDCINNGTFIGNNGTVMVSGDWINNGTFTPNTSTVNFNGIIGQNIGGTGSTTFANLTNSNISNTLTAQLGFAVNNVLNIPNTASVLDMTTFALTGGGSFSNLGSGEIMTTNNTATPVPAGKTWNCVVLYNNLAGGQTIVGGTYASLELDNTSGIQTASGNISTSGNLNLNNGGSPVFIMNGFNLGTNTLNITDTGAILDMGNGNLNYTTIAAMEGTIRFSGATNGLAFPSGTVEYYGTTQTVASGTYYNLLFSGVGGSWAIGTDLKIDNTLIINNGAVDVLSLFTLDVGNAVTVTTPGTLTFENNASLLQTTYTGPNTGNITYYRTTTPVVNTDFTYWSSPLSLISGYTLGGVSQNLTLSTMYYSYDANADDWSQETAGTIMQPGKGYTIRGPEPVGPFPPSQSPFNAFFVGVPNNGDVPISIISTDPIFGTSNLIGNPYPSAINADAFLAANSTVIDGTLYFWTHNTGVDASGQYLGDDYASYNSTGGAAGAGSGGDAPSGTIASCQGFFATGMVAGDVTFTNDMRVTGGLTGNNSQFFKISNSKAKKVIAVEKDRIWLDLTNSKGAFKQTLVGYVSGATNNNDSAFDGESFDGNQFVDFYSVNQNKNLVIQGRTLPFDENDTVPLGFRSTIVGDFTINIDHVDGLLANQPVFIEDKLTNTIADLKSGNYTFTTAAGTFNDRFVLRYTNKILGTKDFTPNENKVFVSVKSKQIKVNSFAETIDKVTVYDLSGRQIYQKINVNINEFSIADLVASHNVLVVKTTLQSGKIVSNKIIY